MNSICVGCGLDREIASKGRCVSCASMDWRRRKPQQVKATRKAANRRAKRNQDGSWAAWARRAAKGGLGITARRYDTLSSVRGSADLRRGRPHQRTRQSRSHRARCALYDYWQFGHHVYRVQSSSHGCGPKTVAAVDYRTTRRRPIFRPLRPPTGRRSQPHEAGLSRSKQRSMPTRKRSSRQQRHDQ